jgi:hypothetical protein
VDPCITVAPAVEGRFIGVGRGITVEGDDCTAADPGKAKTGAGAGAGVWSDDIKPLRHVSWRISCYASKRAV